MGGLQRLTLVNMCAQIDAVYPYLKRAPRSRGVGVGPLAIVWVRVKGDLDRESRGISRESFPANAHRARLAIRLTVRLPTKNALLSWCLFWLPTLLILSAIVLVVLVIRAVDPVARKLEELRDEADTPEAVEVDE